MFRIKNIIRPPEQLLLDIAPGNFFIMSGFRNDPDPLISYKISPDEFINVNKTSVYPIKNKIVPTNKGTGVVVTLNVELEYHN